MREHPNEDVEYDMLLLDCVVCGTSVMEGWTVPSLADRFYCSVPCLASDRTLTPQQALTAHHTENDIGLHPEEVGDLPEACPRCGSTEPDRFVWAGCQWPTGTWDEWHMPNHVARVLTLFSERKIT